MNLPSGWELVLVLLVVVLVFGAKRLPDSARALGRSMRILKAETKGLHDDGPTPAPPAATAPIAPPAPVPEVAYDGQLLFDAEGRPVQVPAAPVQPVTPAQR